MDECHFDFIKSNTPPWGFSRFLNCTNVTKSRNSSYIEASRLINNPNQSNHLFRQKGNTAVRLIKNMSSFIFFMLFSFFHQGFRTKQMLIETGKDTKAQKEVDIWNNSFENFHCLTQREKTYIFIAVLSQW